MNPPIQVIQHGFMCKEDQAKFTMGSSEDAQRLVQKFEGRKVEGSDK
jgi:hypothetical protein